jgi:hypothetical protein
MHRAQTLPITVIAAVLGGLILPALAARDEGRSGVRHGMISGAGTMAGHCADMMQSMDGGDGRPNSQWHKPSPGAAHQERRSQ